MQLFSVSGAAIDSTHRPFGSVLFVHFYSMCIWRMGCRVCFGSTVEMETWKKNSQLYKIRSATFQRLTINNTCVYLSNIYAHTCTQKRQTLSVSPVGVTIKKMPKWKDVRARRDESIRLNNLFHNLYISVFFFSMNLLSSSLFFYLRFVCAVETFIFAFPNPKKNKQLPTEDARSCWNEHSATIKRQIIRICLPVKSIVKSSNRPFSIANEMRRAHSISTCGSVVVVCVFFSSFKSWFKIHMNFRTLCAYECGQLSPKVFASGTTIHTSICVRRKMKKKKKKNSLQIEFMLMNGHKQCS